jgi:hypothetical protein
MCSDSTLHHLHNHLLVVHNHLHLFRKSHPKVHKTHQDTSAYLAEHK